MSAPTSDEIEYAVDREFAGRLGSRRTVEDERLLQSVREACTEHEAGLSASDGDAAVVGARVALRLIARLGRRYVGEGRVLADEEVST